uniref:AAA ATPase domain-containing protein n=1 Tax=Candidatus Kentrum eta TaxID=2126337 RepID=A0A450V6Z8_9GAMM|nr:MAG: AAA ATPase domain-containing protein [Candidatus Kentron sp. H]VFK00659.1 MAG: AAA ATPase domain-containing protein [Candidatus Kentron sp. H]VFK04645.1 MAG: AAA ATPase domain-containing protein [Candidatus Kentron sp. H]
MKLKKFRVCNFRNIVDSGWVEMDDIITLVGKNESGKTSLLQALWKFNPHKNHPYILDREWPRGRRKERSPEQVVIETEFDFNEEERAALAEIHESTASVTGVRIEKDYQGSFFYTFLPTQPIDGNDSEWSKNHDIKWVISVIEKRIGEPPADASDHFKNQYGPVLKQFIQEVRKNGGSPYAIQQTDAFKSKIAAIHPQHEADQQAIASLKQQLDAAVSELKIKLPLRQAIDTAHEWLPTFIYMDDYRIFTGSAYLDQVQQRFRKNKPTDEDYTIRLIMEQAGLDLDEVVEKGNAPDRELRQYDMDDASSTLTNEIAERWSQRNYKVEFRVDGQQLNMFVKDSDSSDLIRLEERSKGFQWFFSFDMLFMAETGGEFRNAVILLDEPGLHLHAAAQRDLLKRMRAYAKDNQLIYTTHLPFMVDFTRLNNIYVCEEKPKDGVKVHQDWASAGKDARFTLQAALGLSWSQSLFVGQYNLVVEGVTDFWFLSTLSELLRQAEKEGLDEELVITPAGGASKVAYIGTILRGQELRVAVLLDSDPEGQSAYEQLVHQWILEDSHVLMLGPVLGVEGNRCLEDMFAEAYYLGFVRAAYRKELGEKELSVPPQGKRSIVQRVEAALKTLGIEHFNKGRVAKRIMKDLAGKSLEDLPPETVDNFVKVVAEINRLVTKWRRSTPPS